MGYLNRGSPFYGWYTMETPKIKWMIRGYSHFRKQPYNWIFIGYVSIPLYESAPNRNPAWYLITTCWNQNVAGISELCWIPIYMLCLNQVDDNMYRRHQTCIHKSMGLTENGVLPTPKDCHRMFQLKAPGQPFVERTVQFLEQNHNVINPKPSVKTIDHLQQITIGKIMSQTAGYPPVN